MAQSFAKTVYIQQMLATTGITGMYVQIERSGWLYHALQFCGPNQDSGIVCKMLKMLTYRPIFGLNLLLVTLSSASSTCIEPPHCTIYDILCRTHQINSTHAQQQQDKSK